MYDVVYDAKPAKQIASIEHEIVNPAMRALAYLDRKAKGEKVHSPRDKYSFHAEPKLLSCERGCAESSIAGIRQTRGIRYKKSRKEVRADVEIASTHVLLSILPEEEERQDFDYCLYGLF